MESTREEKGMERGRQRHREMERQYKRQHAENQHTAHSTQYSPPPPAPLLSNPTPHSPQPSSSSPPRVSNPCLGCQHARSRARASFFMSQRFHEGPHLHTYSTRCCATPNAAPMQRGREYPPKKLCNPFFALPLSFFCQIIFFLSFLTPHRGEERACGLKATENSCSCSSWI